MKIRPVILTCMLFSLLFLASCASQAVVTEPQAADMTPAESMLTRAALPVTWETTAAAWIGMHGHQQDLVLPPGGVSRPIYGSGMFRYDSSIGSAAVSLGLITYEQGGTVTIEIREGPEYIKGDSSQEGWNTVFVFLDAESKPIMPPVPPETIILHIPDPDEPIQATETPQPAWFTVLNATSNTLTYLDIYTNDMLAVDDLGYNILPDRELVPGKTATILFSEHPDLAEAMLWRYGQLFHVFAEDESQSTYYREWYPDHESLELVISVEDRQGPQVGNLAAEGTIRIVNMTDYALVELYILTPEMEENLDFSIELLGHQALPGGLSVDLRADQVPYLADYLNGTEPDYLLVIAYDEDDYMLVREWYPSYDPWTIDLTYDDYYD